MTRALQRPLILVRGFGGLGVGDEQASPYQGFNDGTVYPQRRGDNYIYEGFVLRALKSSDYPYRDATNVVGYYSQEVAEPENLGELDPADARGKVVLDPAIEARVLGSGTAGTMWIFRYYDLTPRALEEYGRGLMRLVHLIRASARRRGEEFTGVDIVAHSMGGLVVREGLMRMHLDEPGSARTLVHRVVTLGTPHRGISFQRLPSWLVRVLPGVRGAGDELDSFDPTKTLFRRWSECFDVERVLCVVGTDYRSFAVGVSSLANRISTLLDEGHLSTNRSDGLVKQSSAQLPGAPRTFVHKSHAGFDSLVTARESYEVAMRFLHGTHKISLWLDSARILRGQDVFGRSEFYLGVSIKPRSVDFELFRQDAEAENCYGPFRKNDLTDRLPDLAEELDKPLAQFGDRTTGWAGPDRLMWQGWVDATLKPEGAEGLVFRLDLYVGERDSFGFGFSDNVVFRKQYYVQVFPAADGEPIEMYLHTGERHLGRREPLDRHGVRAAASGDAAADIQTARPVDGRPGMWTFDIRGTGLDATFRVGVGAP